MTDSNPTTNYQQSGGFTEGTLQIVAYMFAGLAMMLNIRLSYSAAPYALLRFKLPENLFSVFVRTTSSALELWCLPSMLLGNIMEQVYNYTQDTPSSHAPGIKTFDIQTKAGTLKTNAGSQSTIELGSTYQNDLETGGNVQPGLQTKANTLAEKASALNQAADTLERAAKDTGNPLNPLQGLAGQLKDAAKNDKGSGGLHKAAKDLAGRAGQKADAEAEAVLSAFDNVEKLYEALIDESNKLKNLEPDKQQLITDVVKAYYDVKNTYYQMLITYRIQKKANEFYDAAEKLKQQAALTALPSTPDTPLKALQSNASSEMGNLVQTADQLQRINVGTESEANIVEKYLKVEGAYIALEKMGAFKAASEVAEVQNVKTKFDALRKSYENVLKLRVQELANLAEKLKVAATPLATTVTELRTQAGQLAEAASNPSGSTGLQQKATALVGAIKGDTGDKDGAKAGDVIQAFDTVTESYNDLAKQPKYQELLNSALEKIKEGQDTKLGPDETKVKAVYDSYNNLKTLYDKILMFTKVKYYSSQIDTAAGNLVGSSGDPAEVIKNFNALVTVYKLLDTENQSIVKTEFENLQDEYSNAIYFYKKCIITIPSMFTNWLNFLTFVILFIVYISGGDQGSVTGYYWVMAISGFVFGINMVLVYAVDFRYLPYYIAGENSFPIVTSAILYFATSIFGNRRKYNSDYLVVLIDISISIAIAFVASMLWTMAFKDYRTPKASPDTPNKEVISPALLVLVGMGLVYSIYPGIAPGMIVPFYLIDKIEMVLLVLTTFPPLIFAFSTRFAQSWSPKTEFLVYPESGYKFGGWTEYNANKFEGGPPQKGERVYGWIWHFFDILAPLQIILAVIFVYSIHYKDSSISRSIVNQPKMSTFLTIIFYMCHEIMLATGFPGLVCNGGVTYVLLPTQWIGALLMVLLAFYSIGYITEYKRHDPSEWPTEGMTKWNALCYWLKMASKITNKNFKQLFTTDLWKYLDLFYFN